MQVHQHQMSKEKVNILARFIRAIWKSFPLQLLLLQMKTNHLFIVLWVVLIGMVGFQLGKIIGLPYLFLDPEYLNKVSPQSFFIMGLAVGLLTISFHISSYILIGANFRFLAFVNKPFLVFSINNSLIPGIFIIIYIYRIYFFQRFLGEATDSQAFYFCLAFLSGATAMLLLVMLYFSFTNISYFSVLSEGFFKNLRGNLLYRFTSWRMGFRRRNPIRMTAWYFSALFIPKKVKEKLDESPLVVFSIFTQHHLNAVLIILLFISVLFTLGYFSHTYYLALPAGASILLLFSVIVLILGAFYFWLGQWTITLGIVFFIVYNVGLSEGWFKSEHFVYGLNYSTVKAPYTLAEIRRQNSDSIQKLDMKSTIASLEKWKSKQLLFGEGKPKLVAVTVSGGGLRAAVWAYLGLRHIDSSLGGQELLHRTMLITGASGGMVGAAYYREIFLQGLMDPSISTLDPVYLNNISKDILNPIAFMAVTNDLFYRYKKLRYGGFSYPRDRGTAFEEQLNRNTKGVFDKPISAYAPLERDAIIPWLIISPTIINDGRRLYISPVHMSYMNSIYTITFRKLQGIEFKRMFAMQNATGLRMSSALRMGATFPYVTPNPIMPSSPPMEIMDAGINDNYGVSDAVKFLYTFRKWINENTSGVLLIKLRDSGKETDILQEIKPTFYRKLLNPIRTIYYNTFSSQDNNNDFRLETMDSWLTVPLEEVAYQYLQGSSEQNYERASLSWHLTNREKAGLRNTLQNEINSYATQKVLEFLGDSTNGEHE